jgi:hypothetical protein
MVRTFSSLSFYSPSFPAEGAPLISSVYPIQAPAGSSDTRGTHSPGVPPDNQLLRFDWAWIAAARQVIELNLRNLLKSDRHQDVLRAFLSLEGLRSCSVPGFPPAAPEVGESEGEDGRTFRDGEGWDWAGVEGQWRCVIRPLSPGTMLNIDLGRR